MKTYDSLLVTSNESIKRFASSLDPDHVRQTMNRLDLHPNCWHSDGFS